jgi:hypothetical protein
LRPFNLKHEAISICGLEPAEDCTGSIRGNAFSIIPHDMISQIQESSDDRYTPFHAEPAWAASRIVS